MKVKVKLYGTLSRRVPGYQHSQGLEAEIPDGATVKDLLAILNISESEGAAVFMEDRILAADDRLRRGVSVKILQSISGG